MTPEEGRKLAEETLASGAAYKKMKQWVAAQGGDERYIREPERFPAAAYSREILAKEEGYLAAMDTEAIGRAACQLGAGRKTKADVIDMAAGIRLCKKLGDHVEKGDVLAVLYTEREETLYEAVRLYKQALTFSPDPVKKPPLVHRIIR